MNKNQVDKLFKFAILLATMSFSKRRFYAIYVDFHCLVAKVRTLMLHASISLAS